MSSLSDFLRLSPSLFIHLQFLPIQLTQTLTSSPSAYPRLCSSRPSSFPLLLLVELRSGDATRNSSRQPQFLPHDPILCKGSVHVICCGITATILQIRLRRDSPTETGSGARPSPTETVTVACPDHLVLADLLVAKGIGSITRTPTVIKPVGCRSRRELGERVYFCVRCDFPIAIYGRLIPCDHAFCLECARSDSICYL